MRTVAAILNEHILTIIVFFSGAFVMILEIVGSRIVSPYIGTSLISWTSVIGVVLGSLSVGYFLGGRYVDRNASYKTLSKILGIAALSVGCTKVLEFGMVMPLSQYNVDLRFSSFIISLILFAVPSFTMGMVTPYAVGLTLHSLTTRGRVVGNLYAISTIGSIAGTFASGYVLLPQFGNRVSIILVSIGLLALSLLALVRQRGITMRMIVLYICLTVGIVGIIWYPNPLNIMEIDTTYNRVWIRDALDSATGRPIRQMITGHYGVQSAMYLDDGEDELVFEYTKYYRLADVFLPTVRRALMIGGGGYSYPKDFLRSHPEALLDVVEIDPGVTEVARNYFGLSDNERLQIYHQDGRVFLSHTAQRYDAIFLDAFQKSVEIPDHIVSMEAFQRMHDVLADDGVVLINVISSLSGGRSNIIRSVATTMSRVFPYVSVYAVGGVKLDEEFQNIMVVGSKSEAIPSTADKELQQYLGYEIPVSVFADGQVITDDFSPLEYFSRQLDDQK